MKKYLLSIITLFVGCSPSFASVYGELVNSQNYTWNNLKANTKFTAVDGFGLGYYYSMRNGNDSASQGGVNDQFLTFYDVVTANIGWKNALNGKDIGTAVGGPGIKLDNALAIIFPETAATLRENQKIKAILDAKFLNIYGGWETSNGAFDYGYVLGAQIKF